MGYKFSFSTHKMSKYILLSIIKKKICIFILPFLVKKVTKNSVISTYFISSIASSKKVFNFLLETNQMRRLAIQLCLSNIHIFRAGNTHQI